MNRRFNVNAQHAPSELVVDGVRIHPTLRIGYFKVGISGHGDEFITDKECGEAESDVVHLASCDAIDVLKDRKPDGYRESVFLASIGVDPNYTVFISEDEYEQGVLYPSE